MVVKINEFVHIKNSYIVEKKGVGRLSFVMADGGGGAGGGGGPLHFSKKDASKAFALSWCISWACPPSHEHSLVLITAPRKGPRRF